VTLEACVYDLNVHADANKNKRGANKICLLYHNGILYPNTNVDLFLIEMYFFRAYSLLIVPSLLFLQVSGDM